MFRDRRDAGNQLAKRLRQYKGVKNVLVLALPRGGVITGYEIARSLGLPLDVLIVRKIGAPLQPELAAGAVSEKGTIILNRNIISALDIPDDFIHDEVLKQKEEIRRRVELYRKGKAAMLKAKTVILVDDGVATGATVGAAIAALKEEKIFKLVAAIPVAPPETILELRKIADEVICLETPHDFTAVGNYYRDFNQVSDEEVVKLLNVLASGKEDEKKGEMRLT